MWNDRLLEAARLSNINKTCIYCGKSAKNTSWIGTLCDYLTVYCCSPLGGAECMIRGSTRTLDTNTL